MTVTVSCDSPPTRCRLLSAHVAFSSRTICPALSGFNDKSHFPRKIQQRSLFHSSPRPSCVTLRVLTLSTKLRKEDIKSSTPGMDSYTVYTSINSIGVPGPGDDPGVSRGLVAPKITKNNINQSILDCKGRMDV